MHGLNHIDIGPPVYVNQILIRVLGDRSGIQSGSISFSYQPKLSHKIIWTEEIHNLKWLISCNDHMLCNKYLQDYNARDLGFTKKLIHAVKRIAEDLKAVLNLS